ncbi:MAG: hypothetical protein HY917_03170 [Candidatus Diapherotrites archaeon]|nr:hypothetical protein [Candidatus Diapherotrites archaeon]
MMETIGITDSNKSAVLELFSKSIDIEGYIMEKKTNKRIICPYSKEPIKAADFSVLPGSAIFVNNYYYCFAEYLASRR